jgi:hypothetical protein
MLTYGLVQSPGGEPLEGVDRRKAAFLPGASLLQQEFAHITVLTCCVKTPAPFQGTRRLGIYNDPWRPSSIFGWPDTFAEEAILSSKMYKVELSTTVTLSVKKW